MLSRNASRALRPRAHRPSHSHVTKPAITRTQQPSHLRVTTSAIPVRAMSLMPRWPPAGEFSSLFRLLDEYTDHLTRRIGPDGGIVSDARSRAFAPRFDVRETNDSYVLDGELPGIDQKDINIEFRDPHTLVISGRTERSLERGAPPEESGAGAGAGAEASGESDTKALEKAGDGHRYWVSERSIGEFSRTFTFPAPVDQENVKASLKNGILSITVPKTAAPTGKRITIESE